MFKVLPPESSSWITSPGVVHGCSVVKGPGTSLYIEPGRIFTLSGDNIELTEKIRLTSAIPPTVETARIDYAYINTDNGASQPVYLVGTDRFDVGRYQNISCSSSAILAVIEVGYPLSSSSIVIYNKIPNSGELMVFNCVPSTIPETGKTEFVFPVLAETSHAMNILLDGCLFQTEGIDYTKTSFIDQNGNPRTKVVFTELVPECYTISADIYLGNITI